MNYQDLPSIAFPSKRGDRVPWIKDAQHAHESNTAGNAEQILPALEMWRQVIQTRFHKLYVCTAIRRPIQKIYSAVYSSYLQLRLHDNFEPTKTDPWDLLYNNLSSGKNIMLLLSIVSIMLLPEITSTFCFQSVWSMTNLINGALVRFIIPLMYSNVMQNQRFQYTHYIFYAF